MAVSNLDSLRTTCTQMLDEAKRLIAEHDGKFLPGSQADRECRSHSRPDIFFSASTIGVTLIDLSGEHISMLARVLIEPVEVGGLCTCIRSVLESCALAAWLLDPAIDVKSRVSRVLALRYDGMEQSLKVGRAAKADATDIAKQMARIDALEQEAISLGYSRVADRNAYRVGIGQEMPPATEIIKIMLDAEALYLTLSGVAHGHHWAICQLCYQASEANDDELEGTKINAFTNAMSLDVAAALVARALRAFMHPLWNQCRYFGWDQLKLEELFEKVADQLQWSPRRRFWQPGPAKSSEV